MILQIVLILLMFSPAKAATIHKDGFDDFLKKSKENPTQIFVLEVGATWCHWCHVEAAELKKNQDSNILSEAYWNQVMVDEMPEGAYEDFAKANGYSPTNGLPDSVVFKGGIPIGHMAGWSGIEQLESFIKEVKIFASQSGETNAKTELFPTFASGPNEAEGACVIGIVGDGGSSQAETGNFGVANLLSFASSFKNPQYKKLMSPTVYKTNEVRSKVKDGYFFAPNPFFAAAEKFADASASLGEVENLFKAPGKSAWIMLTGHGTPLGMTVGYQKKGEPGHQWTESMDLMAFNLYNGVKKARIEGKKRVRGLVLQCYGGQFGDAFMPIEGDASTGCAVFASLPEKTSEGCYPIAYAGERKDYLGKAIKLKKPDGKQNARDIHYAIVADAQGHDIPMLSSEYFLLFGPAAKKLGAAAKATAPRDGIIKAKITTENQAVTIYFDRLNNRVMKALDASGQPLPAPELRLISCLAQQTNGWDDIDFYHTSLFFLRSRISGGYFPPVSDCRPVYEVSWPTRPDLGTGQMNTSAYGRDFFNPQAPADAEWLGTSLEELSGEEKMVDITQLKPEARVLISRVLPRFSSYMDVERTTKALEDLAKEIQSFNPGQADAILALNKIANQKQVLDQGITSRTITGLMFRNINDARDGSDLIAGDRLAHLVMAAVAELELRQQAKSDPEAAALVQQLDQMRECEKDIF